MIAQQQEKYITWYDWSKGLHKDHCRIGCQSSYGRCNDNGCGGSEFGKYFKDKPCCRNYG